MPQMTPLITCVVLWNPVSSVAPPINTNILVKKTRATYTLPQKTALGFLLTKE